jgi:hypothetical protein
LSWVGFKDATKRATLAFVSTSLWAVVLVPILAVSGYSLYFIARHFGVPWYIAMCFSTCFDGVALLAADYSVKYAQEGLSGGVPKFVVRAFAVCASFLQTYHAKLGKEPTGSWVFWAALPIGAVFVYEIHIRWAKRKALARAGHAFPKPLPSFGLTTWFLFPFSTLTALKNVVRSRRTALLKAAEPVPVPVQTRVARPEPRREQAAPPPAEPDVPVAETAPTDTVVVPEDEVTRRRAAHKPGTNRHSPDRHIREWARQQRIYGSISDRGPLKQRIKDDYGRAHPEEAVGE